MRLNLGEIAQCLGCGPDRVLWGGSGAGAAGGDSPLKRLARERTAGAPMRQATDPSIAHSWQGAPWAGNTPTGAQADSRLIAPGNLFFCLPGERADGHDFAPDAARAGACAVVALRDPFAGRDEVADMARRVPVFLVEDAKRALWRIAMCHRDTCLARVVGVTGTAGKTSVKEVLSRVLEMRGLTQRNPKNFNNQIGLPLSMLNASADASFWVMEIGISESHDMEELGGILRPDLAIVLNVGDGHTQGLGGRGVAAHKATLLEYIQPGGTAVVSADYPGLCAETETRRPGLERRGVTIVTFSAAGREASCRARYEGQGTGSLGLYSVLCGAYEFRLEAPFRGEFGAENVAAIMAAASRLGLSASEIGHGMSQAVLPDQRFNIRHFAHFTLVDDSYNANPLSATRMIRAAARMAEEQNLPLILVMGEMLELGDKAQSAHEELGRTMALSGANLIFWKGGHNAEVIKGLGEAGYRGAFYPVAGGQEFSQLLEELHLPGGLVLFKGSRGNRLERLVDIFQHGLEAQGDADAV